MSTLVIEGDRPSRHGALLGKALADIAELGRRALGDDAPDMCLTCAYRAGTAPNSTAGTGLLALNCTLGTDPDDFACHHGMKEGKPTRLCGGYIASRAAPWELIVAAVSGLSEVLADGAALDEDEYRAAFDAWLIETDPDSKMDVYQAAMAWELRSAKP